MTIRVLLVDDDALVRSGLRLMLRSAADIDVVGEAADGAAAITSVAELVPDVVLMDIRMPGTDGVTATAAITAAGAALRVVALTLSRRPATDPIYSQSSASACMPHLCN